jgi:hypothetical protein
MNVIEPVFVDEIPAALEPGKLYVSIVYTTAVHLCACGCGSEAVTTLHPARFSLTFDGESVSLHPSVGSSGLACRSHYFITKNRIRWCRPMDERSIAKARHQDRRALDAWDGRALVEPEDARADRHPWRQRLAKVLGK